MKIEVDPKTYKNIPAIKLYGRILGAEDKKLSKRLEFFFKKNYSRVIIDVSEVEFVDSYGTGILVYYHTLMQKSNYEMIFFNSNPNPLNYMKRLFEMSNLDKIFKVCTSIDEIDED